MESCTKIITEKLGLVSHELCVVHEQNGADDFGDTRGYGVAALLQPRRFRGYHRLSMRLGFAISQFIGRVALILRLAGKDALQLKLSRGVTAYW
jgi:hypothetical protein